MKQIPHSVRDDKKGAGKRRVADRIVDQVGRSVKPGTDDQRGIAVVEAVLQGGETKRAGLTARPLQKGTIRKRKTMPRREKREYARGANQPAKRVNLLKE